MLLTFIRLIQKTKPIITMTKKFILSKIALNLKKMGKRLVTILAILISIIKVNKKLLSSISPDFDI